MRKTIPTKSEQKAAELRTEMRSIGLPVSMASSITDMTAAIESERAFVTSPKYIAARAACADALAKLPRPVSKQDRAFYALLDKSSEAYRVYAYHVANPGDGPMKIARSIKSCRSLAHVSRQQVYRALDAARALGLPV